MHPIQVMIKYNCIFWEFSKKVETSLNVTSHIYIYLPIVYYFVAHYFVHTLQLSIRKEYKFHICRW